MYISEVTGDGEEQRKVKWVHPLGEAPLRVGVGGGREGRQEEEENRG